MITWVQSGFLSGLSVKGKKAIWFKRLEWLFSQNDISRLLKDGLRYNLPAFFNDYLPIPSNDRRNKEWIVFKRRKEYQVAKITMKSHKKDMLSVEIWNIASFDSHLGNLYQLEKPARSLTLDIPRKSARTLNVTHKDGNFATNTPLNLITTNCLCVSTNNQYADGSPVLTNDDSSPTSISESIEYSESGIASTPAIVLIDQDRLIGIRFGSSDLTKTLMDVC
ncbi:unnamed protein product [Rhizophagus irregularis]|uniref:Uncharacterized protein n=2 Tax=Rhizophagus irregularis TaxID=588596 RepID=A0A915ZMX9_9GLOM|nr:unnamed protein product [Rhizophagus irregularis]CAB5195154.1 unnamed protein product [Rhizophagus irregularis]CAB5382816.1 unnamed protein product [Rhizophagus irregularis]